MSRRDFNKLVAAGAVLLGASALGYQGCHNRGKIDEPEPSGHNQNYVSYKNGVVDVQLPYTTEQLTQRNLRSREVFLIANKTDPTRTVDVITGKYGHIISSSSRKHGINPGSLEGIIYVESGADSNDTNDSGAAGIVQIMPETADAYRMDVNYEMSEWYTSEIFRLKEALEQESNSSRADKIKGTIASYQIKRAAIDERFNPYKSIEIAARYLGDEKEKFGRDDFAIWTYHAGRTNILNAIEKFLSPKPLIMAGKGIIDIKGTMKKYGLTYADLYFGCSPYTTNPGSYNFLHNTLKDSSAQYPWNTMAAERLVRMSKKDPLRFHALVDKIMHPKITRKGPIGEETTIWYNPDTDRQYTDVNEIISALDKGELVKLPKNPRALGFVVNKDEIGEYASPDVKKFFYSTKPETVGMLITLASIARHESGKYNQHLIVNSAVRSEAYQKRIPGGSEFTSHALGRGVDISRHYKSERQSRGLQYALDSLIDANMIRALKEDENHLHLVVNSDPEVVKYFKAVYEQTMKLVA